MRGLMPYWANNDTLMLYNVIKFKERYPDCTIGYDPYLKKDTVLYYNTGLGRDMLFLSPVMFKKYNQLVTVEKV